jgi:hypothetical protein
MMTQVSCKIAMQYLMQDKNVYRQMMGVTLWIDALVWFYKHREFDYSFLFAGQNMYERVCHNCFAFA